MDVWAGQFVMLTVSCMLIARCGGSCIHDFVLMRIWLGISLGLGIVLMGLRLGIGLDFGTKIHGLELN